MIRPDLVMLFPQSDSEVVVVTYFDPMPPCFAQARWANGRYDEEETYTESLGSDHPYDEARPEPPGFDEQRRITAPPEFEGTWRSQTDGVRVKITVSGARYADFTADPDCEVVVAWEERAGCYASDLEGREVTLLVLPTKAEVNAATDIQGQDRGATKIVDLHCGA